MSKKRWCSSSSSSIHPEYTDVVKKSNCASSIPEDVVIEILRRLPLESLHRFKWVSKSGWYPLITKQVLPKFISPPPLVGFFDHMKTFHSLLHPPPFDPTLSFLHRPSLYRRSIKDSCNGLIIFFGFRNRLGESAFYLVCNPSTASWTEIPAIAYPTHPGDVLDSVWPMHCILDFDPWRGASPHYKLVTLFFCTLDITTDDHRVVVRVYDSNARMWWQRDFMGHHVFPNSYQRQHHAVWNGAVYMLCYRGSISDESYLIIRFGGLGRSPDNNNDKATLEFIDFPRGLQLKSPLNRTCIGNSGGKLLLANLDQDLMQIRVWSLLLHEGGEEDNNNNNYYEWVMVHESTVSALNGGSRCKPGVWIQLHVVGFHPVMEAVFILHDGVLFTYDLAETRLDEHFRVIPEWITCLMPSVFPFSPCSLDMLDNRNQQQNSSIGDTSIF